MLHKRERFERSDVPRNAAAGTAMAVAALVFIVVGLLIGLRVAQSLSERDESTGVKALKSSISSQADATVPDGYQASTDLFTNVLILTVDDVDNDTPGLTAAQILSINATTNTGVLANIPVNMRVTNDAREWSLQRLCGDSGSAACVVPVSASSGVRFTHVIVTEGDVFAKFDELRGMGVEALVTYAGDLFSTFRTDMSSSELVEFVNKVDAVGSANFARVDAPYTDGTLSDGSPLAVLDATQLRVSLGILRPIEEASAEEGSSEEGSGEETGSEGGSGEGY